MFRKLTILIFALLLAFPVLLTGQSNPDCYSKKDFLIISSTKQYNNALMLAEKASKELNLKLKLRNLKPVSRKNFGLSLSEKICKKEYNEKYCYIARGRWDDGVYISIEYSSAYLDFSEDYYIVIVASGDRKTKGIRATLKTVKTKYKDAYIKTSKVYMCCMH